MAKTTLLQVLPLLILAVVKIVQLRLAKLNLSPIYFDLPDLPDLLELDERLATNNVNFEKIGEGGELPYPECLVLSSDEQYMFASLGDGRVARIGNPQADNLDELKIEFIGRTGEDDENCGKGGPADNWADGANMESKCGRPLGLWLLNSTEGNDDGLLVADAYKGFVIFTNIYGDQASIQTLATRAESDPLEYNFTLLNAVVATRKGDIYLTETSTKHQRRRLFHAAMEGHATGRLLRYRNETGKVEVVADNIAMANGVTQSHDEKSLLIVSGVRVLKFNLETQKLDTDPFVMVMPGTGDNIKTMDTTPDGRKVKCYWAALGSPYKKPFSLFKFVADKVWIRSFILAFVPYETLIQLIPKWSVVAVYDEEGNLMETLRDDGKMVDEKGKKLGVSVPWLSELEPVGDWVYLASWYNPFLARIKRGSIVAKGQW